MVFKDLRGKASDWFVKILLSLIILSFTLWGVPEFLRGYASGSTVAKAGPVDISKSYIQERIKNVLERFQENVTIEKAVALGLHKHVLNSIITEILIDLEIQDLKLVSSDQSLLFQAQHDATFQDENGRFSSEKLESIVRTAGLSEKQFLSQIRSRLLQQQLAVAVSAQTYIPAQLLSQIMHAMHQKRDIDIVLISSNDFPLPTTASDEELKVFYDTHKKEFETPELRRSTIISITPDALVRDNDVSDQQLRYTYETNREYFSTPETREILVASLKEDKELNDLKQAVKSKKYGKHFQNFGHVPQGVLKEEIDSVAFGLKQDTLSQIIDTSEGKRIILITDIRPTTVELLQAVRPQVLKRAKRDLAQEKMLALSSEIDDKISSGSILEEIANEYDFMLIRTNAIDRTGQSAESEGTNNLSEDILNTIFSQEEKVDGIFQETNDGTTYLVRVDEIISPSIPSFQTIQSNVEQAYKAKARQEAALYTAQNIQKSLKSGASSIQTIVNMHTAATQKSFNNVTRAELAEKTPLPGAFISKIYNAPPGESLIDANDDTAIVAVTRSIASEESTHNANDTAEIRALIENTLTQDLESSFVNTLKEKFGVSVDEERLEQLAE